MIVVKVELWSAVTGTKTELARMHIANTGISASPSIGNYIVQTLKGRSTEQLDQRVVQREGCVMAWPRLDRHVWRLVTAALKDMGYDKR
jgi:hypothetical protein